MNLDRYCRDVYNRATSDVTSVATRSRKKGGVSRNMPPLRNTYYDAPLLVYKHLNTLLNGTIILKAFSPAKQPIFHHGKRVRPYRWTYVASLLFSKRGRAKPLVATSGLHIFVEGGAPCWAVHMTEASSIYVPGKQLWPNHPPPRNHQLFHCLLGLPCSLGYACSSRNATALLVTI